MTDPAARAAYSRAVTLDRLLYTVRQYLHDLPFAADSAVLVRHAELMALELRAEVLAEHLPPEQVHHTVRDTQTFSGEVRDQRFASWWDHFKATYRQRRWMRWRYWTVRFQTVVIPYRQQVACRHRVTVNVRQHITYPRARVALPPDQFGRPVVVSVHDVGHTSAALLRTPP